MKFEQQVTLHGIKESKGTVDGREFDSTIFHIEADLSSNGVGRSIGKVTSPFKCGNSSEFDKWKHLEGSLPIKCVAQFEMQANGKGENKIIMQFIRPLERVKPSA